MNCLNLCDILNSIDIVNGNLKKLLQSTEYPNISRLYFGSYFCSQYFLRMDFLSELAQFAKENCLALTLVIPITSEKDLSSVKEQIHRLIIALPIDELTVNDIGMLDSLHKSYSVTFNLGRLFFKDARDIRIPAFYRQMIHPAALDMLDDYNIYNISFAEMDAVNAVLNLQSNSQIRFALHTPFCYLTMGHICKFASIEKDILLKFRPNSSCQKECQHIFETYTPPLKNYTLYRIGRAVYFETEIPQTINGEFRRIIYFPFHQIATWRKEGE